MRRMINVQSFFRWLGSQKATERKSKKVELFRPLADALEVRRLLTLNVWIQNDNNLVVDADNDVAQYLRIEYQPAVGVTPASYTVTSLTSTENFVIITNNPDGLTVSNTDYNPVTFDPATLTITETTGLLSSVSLSTGSGRDQFDDYVGGDGSQATVYISSGGGADQIIKYGEFSSSILVVDGGSGDDQLLVNLQAPTATTLTQNYFTSPVDPTAVICDIALDDAVTYNTMNIQAANVEAFSNLINAPNADYFQTINGQFATAFGSLADTSMSLLDTIVLTNSAEFSVIGYETNDEMTAVATSSGLPGVMVQGLGLPTSNIYTQTSSTGVLRMLGLAGNDRLKADPGVEALLNVSLYGGDGDDLLRADATLIGGAGNDTLVGGVGNDSLDGGDGNDMFLLSGGTDTISGGNGFDQIYVPGDAGINNTFMITQNTAAPAVISVNGVSSTLTLSSIDQISIQGSTGTDNVIVFGNSNLPVPVFASLGEGNDSVNTFSASQQQTVTAYGEAGQDSYSAGAGTDNFYGGDDFDSFTLLANSVISSDTFDGGSGTNQLQVYNVAGGTTTISPIPGGFDISNLAPGSASLSARNVGSIQVLMNATSTGLLVNGTSGDDTIRTFDSSSGFVPPLSANSLLISGLSVDINAINVQAGQTVTIHGQGGNDTFQALGTSASTLNFFGDAGNDTLLVDSLSKASVFTGGAGLNAVLVTSTTGNDMVVLAQAVSGTPYSVTLNGVLSSVTGVSEFGINGLEGNDTITAGAQDAVNVAVSGESGNDVINLAGIVSASSTSSVDAGSGNDTITGASGGSVVLYGGLGNDTMNLVGPGVAFGEDGDDSITGSTGNDSISGGSGNDIIDGLAGSDYLTGDAGLDTITSGSGNDTINGGADSDQIIVPINGQSVNIDGGTGNDLLWLQGTGGDDAVTMSSILGAATINSGGMNLNLTDTETYYIDLGDQSDSLTMGDMSQVQIEMVEFAAGTGVNAVNVLGTYGDNDIHIDLNSGGSVVTSGLGYLLEIVGATTADTLSIDGGAGNDTLKAAAGTDAVIQISLSGGDGDDLLSADATLNGGAGNDTFIVPVGTNTINGGTGFDTILVEGTGGDDTIAVSQSAAGLVTLNVNTNSSTNSVTSIEKIDIAAFAGIDTVTLSGDGTIWMEVDAGAGNDTVDASALSAIGVTIAGGDGNDVITGTPMDDSIYGGSGNDSITGGAGNDNLAGEAGLDYIISITGNDTILGGSESDTVEITLDSQTLYIDGGTGKDLIWIKGTAGNDDLTITSNLGAVVITADGSTKSALVDIEDYYIELGNENDTLTMADMSQAQIGLGVFAFVGGTGNNTVNVIGTTSNDLITIGINYDVQVAVLGLGYELELRNVDTADLLNVSGRVGNDTIMAASGVESLVQISLSGGDGDDLLSADATLIGGAGNDTLVGGVGNDSLDGGAGDDLFILSGGSDTVIGGTGFDILLVQGSTGASNNFSVTQNNAVPVSVDVNATVYSIDMTEIDQISIQGSTGNDSLAVIGDSLTPVPVLAMLGSGDDGVDASLASSAQLTTAYGESGNDYFASGAGTDNFYGGDDFDIFVTTPQSVNSFDKFDGGTGFNMLDVAAVAGGTNIITAIPSGFEVTNTAGTGVTTALNVGSISVDSGGGGVSVFGSNGDDTIRTFDSSSDLVPALAAGELLVSGLPGDITITGMTPASIVDIHGEGGNDTFQALGNATGTVNFYGDSGDDTLIVTQESVLSTFSGGAGTDTVQVQGTVNDDSISLDDNLGVEEVNYNSVVNAAIVDAEIVQVDALDGSDMIQVGSVSAPSGLSVFNLYGNDGNDYIAAYGVYSGSFMLDGGTGNDSFSGPDGSSSVTVYGGDGSDSISAGLAAAAIYGGSGNDSINGSDGLDSIYCGDGDDVINGGAANDQIDAGEGNDTIIWSLGGGNDTIDGGTGQDSLVAYGNLSASNNYELQPQAQFSNLFEVLIAGNIIGGGAIEQVSLTGGSAADSFNIGDLSQTSITLVDVNFLTDLAADSVSVMGSAGFDEIILSGSATAQVTGLPWLVRVQGAAFSATTLIDGILIDGGLGEDTIISSVDLTSPLLVTLQGGQGGDDIRVNSPVLGDNTNRVTVNVGDDSFGDLITLNNGQNLVLGGPSDVVQVNGTENNDFISISGLTSLNRVDISVNSLFSSNDLTGFTGVIHADALGGNDRVTLNAVSIPTTISGGDGDDSIDASSPTWVTDPALVNVTMYGGSGNDSLTAGYGSDYLDGGDGEDVLTLSTAVFSTLSGGAGDDLFILYPIVQGVLSPRITGGTGTDSVVVSGSSSNSNAYVLGPNTAADPLQTSLQLTSGGTTILATGFDIEGYELGGGTQSDTFDVQDLTNLGIQYVQINLSGALGGDSAADMVTVSGSNMPDNIRLSSSIPSGAVLPVANVDGLPWAVQIQNAALLGNTLVDGISIQGGLGEDAIYATDSLTVEVLVTINGGAGSDDLRTAAPALGDNSVRVTIQANSDGFGDSIRLFNGNNAVLGNASDVIYVDGTNNSDTIGLTGSGGGSVLTLSVNGMSSVNDISAYSGTVVVDGMGNNDIISAAGYSLATSVNGGTGSDLIDASGMAVSVSINGGDGDDSISGGSAADFIETGTGLNLVQGLGGNDTIIGGAQTDGYYWSEGDGFDFLAAGGGLDYIFAFGADGGVNQFSVQRYFTTYRMFYNGDPNQGFQAEDVSSATFVAGSGSAATGTVQDMTGISVDRLLFDFSQAATASTSVDGSIAGDNLLVDVNSYDTGLLEIAGLSYQFRLLGTPTQANNVLTVNGLGGNDTIKTTSQADALALITLDGGAGDDLLSADATLLGGTGNDTFIVPVGVNTIDGGDGFDTIQVDGTNGNDVIGVNQVAGVVSISVNTNTSTNTVTNVELISVNALAGNDTITLTGDASALTTTVYAGEGNDELDASNMITNVTAYGDSGDDTFIGGSGDDTFYGGAGNDLLIGRSGNDLLFGEDGADELSGGMGHDELYGGADSDLLLPGNNNSPSPELVDGGSGLDQVAFELNATSGIIGRTAGFVNVGEFGAVDPPVAFNAVDAEDLMITVDSTVPGSTGYDLTIQDLTGSQVDFVRVAFVDPADNNQLNLQGTQGNDTITADFVLPPGGEPEVSVIMPWGTVWGYTPSATTPANTLAIQGMNGDDNLKANYDLSQGAFAWNVQLDGGDGNDLLNGDATLLGGAGNDTFIVPVGVNTIDGGDGFDTIQVDGTNGNDVIGVNQVAGVVTISVNTNTSTNTVTNVELIQVDALVGNDLITLSGTGTINTIVQAGDGNDSVVATGYMAPASIYGGSGNDQVLGGEANELIDTGTGNDTINGNSGNDTILAGDGNDLIYWMAGGGTDVVDGGTGDDQLVAFGDQAISNAMTLTPNTTGGPSTAPGVGLGNANMIKLTNNSQTILTGGSIEAVSLAGGAGCDSFGIGNLHTTDVQVVDVIFNTNADGGVVSTYATNLPDIITITADAADQIGVNGLAVPVRVFNTKPTTAVVVHAGFGGDNIEVDPQAETQAIIVVDGGSGDDTISGGSFIIGGNGNNLLIGSDGPNTIVGGTGSDTILGLGGNDLLFGDAQVLNVDIPGPNCDYLAGLIILPTATGAPDVIDAGEGNDSVNGNVGADTIIGGNGDDEIGEFTYHGVFFPEPGNDIIDGGEGNNCVFSGDGDDQVTVGGGNNLIILGAGNDLANTGNGNNTVFGGSGNDTVNTGSGNDIVVLGAGNDVASLNDGNDLAWGEDGNDFVIGGMGDDTLYGGNGNDTLWGGTHATKPLGKGQWHAVLKPFDGNDVIAGEMGRDQVDGGTGSNIMDAGADNIRETMVGSGGWDTAYIHKNEGRNQDVLMNHSKRYTLIPYGSMPVAPVPLTPMDCNTPITVVIPDPRSGATPKPSARKAANPKSVSSLFRRLTK